MIRKIDLRFAPGVIPTVYEDTLSFYELIKKMGFTINQLIERVDYAEETAVKERLKELLVNVTYNAETQTAILSFDEEEPVLVDEVISAMQIGGKIYPVRDAETAEKLEALTERVDGLRPGTPCIYHSLGPNMANPTPSGAETHYAIFVGKVYPDTEVSDDFTFSTRQKAYATLERAFQDWDEHTDNCYITLYGDRNANGDFVPTTYYINRRTFAGGQLHFLVHSPNITIEWGTDSADYDHLFYNMYMHFSGYEDPTDKSKITTKVVYKGKKQGWYMEGVTLTSNLLEWVDSSNDHDMIFGFSKCFVDIGRSKFGLPFYAHNSQVWIGENTEFAPAYNSANACATFSRGTKVFFDRDATASKPITFRLPDNHSSFIGALRLVDAEAYANGSYLKFENTSDKPNLYCRYSDLYFLDADVTRLQNALGTPDVENSFLNGYTLHSNDLVVGISLATNVAVDGTISRPFTPFVICTVSGSDGKNYRIPCYIGGAQTGKYWATMQMYNSTKNITIGYVISKTSIKFESIKDGTSDTTISRVSTC